MATLTVTSPLPSSLPMVEDEKEQSLMEKAKIVVPKKPKKMSLVEFLNSKEVTTAGGKKEVVVLNVTDTLTSEAALDLLDPVVVAKRPNPRDIFSKYNGTISNKTGKPQYVRIQDVANKLLFSQTTVSDFNKSAKVDYPLDYLADAMFLEFKRDIDRYGDGALDVVDMGGGFFTSLDNRRLLIAKKIGAVDRTYGIWIRVHSFGETLTPGLQKRFGGAKTWGQAALDRVNDKRYFGYLGLPTIMTTNLLDKRVPAPSQNIRLSVDCDLSQLHAVDSAAIKKAAVNNIITI